ncbi:cell division protein FtsK [Fodinicola acaciae]|uniref:cell division protein FtsK n=1 Tax=Fodinicola acaciae TaxID=2681555 RepID=UPI0013D14349|nr:cell division protein FtsK [Fodinicola acaciae]
MATRPPDDGDSRDFDPFDSDGAEILDLDALRRRTNGKELIPAQRQPDHGDGNSPDAADRESVEVAPMVIGPPVDPPDEPVHVGSRWAGRKWRARARTRRPIIPPWLLSRADLAAAVRWAIKDMLYLAGYHAVRIPKYVAKIAVYAPVGAFRLFGRMLRWATAEEGNWALRQWAADHNDPATWLRLDQRRADQSRFRWIIVVAGSIAAFVAGMVFLYVPIPDVARWVFYSIMALLFARSGRPTDKPIVDRVANGPRYRKLTAELVRRGLTSIQLAGINQAVSKDPAAITFPVEIHRDGPGHMAVVDLPYGVEAADVIARRGRLASALRLPLDQVWPEPDRAHTGRLRLWVGHEPASAMKAPPWPLLHGPKVDIFEPFPFATDPRLRPIYGQMIARNWLFGGMPGSGKSRALRIPILAAALDPRVEIRCYELKGTGDFKVLEQVLAEYGNGFDDDTVAGAAGMLDWLYVDCQRRSKRVAFYAAKGMAPENKVTPELASLKGSGLHPLVVNIDEIQELITHPVHGKRAGELLEKIIKLGRALGVTLLLGTQIPDKDSLPPGITRNVNTRFCLAVADQIANDMILGTSMYRNGYRATEFGPEEPGWGITVGMGKPAPAHAYDVDQAAAEAVVGRAVALRAIAGTLPTEPAQRQVGPGYDVLRDLMTVWPSGVEREWNETLLDRLNQLRADVYGGWKPEQLTAALKPYGITVGQIGRRIDGVMTNRRGPARDDIVAAIAQRDRKSTD